MIHRHVSSFINIRSKLSEMKGDSMGFYGQLVNLSHKGNTFHMCIHRDETDNTRMIKGNLILKKHNGKGILNSQPPMSAIIASILGRK